MNLNSNGDFRTLVLKNLSFNQYKETYYSLYTNKERPELGYLLNYCRPDYYNLDLADFTIPKDFSLNFNNKILSMRFGLVYEGITEFKLQNSPIASFTPSSFFVIEKDIKGQQNWKKGQHYHGTEITIYERYFNEVIKPIFPTALNFHSILQNYTYVYLPLEITNIIQKLESLANENLLTSLYLEAKILECIAILMNEIIKTPENAFTNQIDYGSITIGQNRTIKLTSSDIHAIQKAHDILLNNYTNPPSISILSKIVFLNEQKLKAGFSKQYHMSIGAYINHVKMTVAANLLCTTDLSIECIALEVGYNYSANFSKMFKRIYGMTPLKFRKSK